MRALVVAFVAAVILGLIPVEMTALILAAIALPVALVALMMALEMRRTFREEMDRQTDSARALESAAGRVDKRIRSDGV